MKYTIIAILMLAAGFGLAYLVLPSDNTQAVVAENTSVQLYTCGMHPEIISDKPGYCPICGMKLTPKKDGGTIAGAVNIDPTTRQNMGLVTQPASYRTITRHITAFGKVAYAEPNIYNVNLKIDGWVEKLFVNYEGDRVFKGQALLEIYSPELVAAQKEFLIANKASLSDANTEIESNMRNLLSAARERLANWDISEEQIERLVNEGTVTRTMKIKSPVNGYIMMKHVDEGAHLGPGTRLYDIADLSHVWVKAYVYEQDVPFLAKGQMARVKFTNLPGEEYTAKIAYISPFLDKQRQVEIRLDLQNPNQKLRPEMYAEVDILSEMDRESLVIPRAAVINSGLKQVVFVAENDEAYMPRVINTGVVGDNDLVEVKSGLQAGDKVVTSGQFLLDSESRLEETLGGHGGMQMDMPAGNNDKDKTGHEHNHDMTSNTKDKPESTDSKLSGIYTCPMPQHYHVLQFGEGTCPECGMKLVPIEETNNTEVYVCPMDADSVVQDKPGRCPTCGMKLEKVELHKETGSENMTHHHEGDMHNTEQGKDQTMHDMKTAPADSTKLSGVYTCPMQQHYHVVQYGEGTCSECGMKLVPVEETDNHDVYVCPMKSCQVAQLGPGDCPVCGMHLKKLEPEASDDK